jgi:hypothetical protein
MEKEQGRERRESQQRSSDEKKGSIVAGFKDLFMGKDPNKTTLFYLRQKCSSPVSISLTSCFSDSDSDGGNSSSEGGSSVSSEDEYEVINFDTTTPLHSEDVPLADPWIIVCEE